VRRDSEHPAQLVEFAIDGRNFASLVIRFGIGFKLALVACNVLRRGECEELYIADFR
jgi:hypothetical protein